MKQLFFLRLCLSFSLVDSVYHSIHCCLKSILFFPLTFSASSSQYRRFSCTMPAIVFGFLQWFFLHERKARVVSSLWSWYSARSRSTKRLWNLLLLFLDRWPTTLLRLSLFRTLYTMCFTPLWVRVGHFSVYIFLIFPSISHSFGLLRNTGALFAHRDRDLYEMLRFSVPSEIARTMTMSHSVSWWRVGVESWRCANISWEADQADRLTSASDLSRNSTQQAHTNLDFIHHELYNVLIRYPFAVLLLFST